MKTIALIAHNEKKNELLEWAKQNITILRQYNLIGTSNTARLINSLLNLNVKPFGHGPSGGDILLSAKILRGKVQKVIFFIDSENPHGHEHDIQTLIRTAVINNVPIALNRASADYIIMELETPAP
ncbi:MAG: methylglyoxal synthase [Cytophagales bacterium CG18_big_fil_WC_8_21_14_2_50_42_9]|nr:MAG: methylglyoxal synthase [Cytophagales bacterium CG18_big_fil_WC_8_21_14_2_50_42_9]